METKVDVLDEKVSAQISEIEQRLGQKLDSQHGILVALIDRVRSLDNEIISLEDYALPLLFFFL